MSDPSPDPPDVNHAECVRVDSSRGAVIGSAAVVIVALILVAATLGMTRIAFFKETDTDGFWHARILEVTLLLPPLAAIFFAHGVAWWRRGLRVRGLAALAAFPAWALVLFSVNTVIANDFWWAIVGMQLQGMQPFGAVQ